MGIKWIYKWITQSRIDTIAKLLLGIGGIIASIYVPITINRNAESNRMAISSDAERNRNNQLYVEIVSNREIADSELRARMFENLLTSFFENTKQQEPKEKLTLLRLIALNFHETFDFKPLFEELDADLLDSIETCHRLPDYNTTKSFMLEHYDRLHLRLREVATAIVGKQEALLSQVEEGMIFEETIYIGDMNAILIPPDHLDPYKGHRLGITCTKIGDDSDYVKLNVKDFPEGTINIAENVNVDLDLSYYNMPLIDNTKLFNGTRFAITFKGIVTDTTDTLRVNAANIKIMFFPETYMSSRDRPYIDEMLQNLKRK